MRPVSVPQFSSEPVGIQTYLQGSPFDPDDNLVELQIINTDSNTVIVSSGTIASRESTGTYQYLLTSTQTSIQGNYDTYWYYTISGSPREFIDPFVIGGQMPYWQNLTFEERQLICGIVHRLDKSFDSSQGGPYLQGLNQSGLNMYEDASMEMTDEVMDYINYEFQPVFKPAYEIGNNAMVPFPSTYTGVLATQTYAHFLKHIARNYIEQPQPEGMNAAWMNRRDYFDRWWKLYLFEKEIADKQLRQMKRWYLVGSKRALLVAGGLIPRMFINPARPHFQYAAVNMAGM